MAGLFAISPGIVTGSGIDETSCGFIIAAVP